MLDRRLQQVEKALGREAATAMWRAGGPPARIEKVVALELEARSRHSDDMKGSIIAARPPEDQLWDMPVKTFQQS